MLVSTCFFIFTRNDGFLFFALREGKKVGDSVSRSDWSVSAESAKLLASPRGDRLTTSAVSPLGGRNVTSGAKSSIADPSDRGR